MKPGKIYKLKNSHVISTSVCEYILVDKVRKNLSALGTLCIDYYHLDEDKLKIAMYTDPNIWEEL